VILYVNGDSHSAGAELVCMRNGKLLEFDENTRQYQPIQSNTRSQDPQVECVNRSYSQRLANMLGADLICEAESGGSNARILRLTREYLKNNRPDLVVIGWSPFEREEWWYNGVAHQVNGGGVKSVPAELANRYKKWVIDNSDSDAINTRTVASHQEIFSFHRELLDLSIPHLFFNTFNSFEFIPDMGSTYFDWGNYFVEPYSESYTYCLWLKNQGYRPVSETSMHFGPAAHRAWAEFLYQNYFKK
jgi:hypothetical protein